MGGLSYRNKMFEDPNMVDLFIYYFLFKTWIDFMYILECFQFFLFFVGCFCGFFLLPLMMMTKNLDQKKIKKVTTKKCLLWEKHVSYKILVDLFDIFFLFYLVIWDFKAETLCVRRDTTCNDTPKRDNLQKNEMTVLYPSNWINNEMGLYCHFYHDVIIWWGVTTQFHKDFMCML